MGAVSVSSIHLRDLTEEFTRILVDSSDAMSYSGGRSSTRARSVFPPIPRPFEDASKATVFRRSPLQEMHRW